jgi:hypothetical protein
MRERESRTSQRASWCWPARYGPSDALIKKSGEPAICKEDTRRLPVHAKVVFTNLRYGIGIGTSTAMPWSCLSAAGKTWCGNFAYIVRRAIQRTKIQRPGPLYTLVHVHLDAPFVTAGPAGGGIKGTSQWAPVPRPAGFRAQKDLQAAEKKPDNCIGDRAIESPTQRFRVRD